MSKLLLATNNQGKVHEYRSLLQEIPFELVTPAQIGIKLEVEETGSSFEENARLKAVAFARASGLLTLADDSGLEVDILNGEPGVRSHRYAGEDATDEELIKFLLDKLKNVPLEKRTAHFRCVIAIAWPDGEVVFCSGRCSGLITFTPSGREGFGYDPVFYFPELKQTMAELPLDMKNQVSHRAMAAREARKVLKQIKAGFRPAAPDSAGPG
jgi:XTP/dITP diphosphohydrolase